MSDELTEEIPENESKEERKRRLAKLRARKCRAKKRIEKEKQEWINAIGKPTRSEFTPSEPSKRKDQFDGLEPDLYRTFGSSEGEKLAESKALEHAVNESLERQTQKMLCPFCHSSVCRCNRGEPE